MKGKMPAIRERVALIIESDEKIPVKWDLSIPMLQD
tara:strand:- start:5010 stop:5117 length:108 start_codon:yes stop_codon:yes gene_type:complete